MDNWITVPLTTFVNDRHLDTAHARAGQLQRTNALQICVLNTQ